ncbi:MAG TPA: SpoIIE family protein phosphatase [Holophagaceae bacterium]|nr:SpoIIE family protein phosphatase [Holophagaceae bacterium]
MNPYLRRIRWRLIWLSLASLGLAVGTFVLSQWVYSFSDDQCLWKLEKGQILIRQVLPNGVAEEAGLLDGDILLSIQGHKLPGTPQGVQQAQSIINAKSEGTVLSYAIKRGDRTLYLPVRLVKPLDYTRLVLLIAGIIAWAVGLLAVVSTPERKSARHFFYLGCLSLLASTTVFQFLGDPSTLFALSLLLTIFVVTALFPPMLIHFFLRFPHPFEARKSRRLLQAMYGTGAIIGILLTLSAATSPLGQRMGIPALPDAIRGVLNRVAAAGYRLSNLAAIAFSLGLFVKGFLHTEGRQRRALLPCLIVTLAVMTELLAYYVLSLYYTEDLAFNRTRWIFLLPLPLIPLSFAWAIIRHGLFDVRRTLLRWVSYFAVLAAALALYLGGLAWAFSRGFSTLPTGWAGALIGLAALPLGWLFRAMLRRIRKRFRRDMQSTRDMVLGTLREPRKRLNEEAPIRALSDALKEAFQPQTLLTLPFDGDAITLPSAETGDGQEVPRSVHHAQKLRLPASLLRHARENRELVLGLGSEEADWVREQGESLRALVTALELQLLVLVMVDDRPHTAVLLGPKYAEMSYGREDREILREAAMTAGQTLETAALHRRAMEQERLSQELDTARRIQESLVSSAPTVPGFQIALRLEPALETGGDLLFVKRRPSGRWLAAVGDISGKGLAAALYMAQATALLEQATQLEDQPLEQILHNLDETLRHLLGQNGFLTLALVEWEEGGCYRLARAGHPAALLLEGHGETGLREVIPHGRGLGLRPAGPRDWQIVEGVLPPKGWLVLYSDGLTEAMNRKGELYGLERFGQQLQRLWGTGSVRAACEAVFRDVAAFDTQNRDDRTLFILGREAVS